MKEPFDFVLSSEVVHGLRVSMMVDERALHPIPWLQECSWTGCSVDMMWSYEYDMFIVVHDVTMMVDERPIPRLQECSWTGCSVDMMWSYGYDMVIVVHDENNPKQHKS